MYKKIIIVLFFIFLPFYTMAEYSIQNSVDYIKSLSQNHATTRALMAFGEQPENLDTSYLNDLSIFTEDNVATLAGYILAVISIGEDPSNYKGYDMISLLKSFENNGQIGTIDCPWVGGMCTNDDIWSAIALSAFGEDINSSIMQNIKNFLLNNQNQDGGWGSSTDSISDTDSTASAVMALLELGLDKDSDAIRSAISYIKNQQVSDGGFSCGGPFWCKDEGGNLISNPDTTSWVVSMIYKLGEDPNMPDWRMGNIDLVKSPILYLQENQDENGKIGFSTPYALVALLGKYYPLFRFETHGSELNNPGSVVLPVYNGGSGFVKDEKTESQISIPPLKGHKILVDSKKGYFAELRVPDNVFDSKVIISYNPVEVKSLKGPKLSDAVVGDYVYDFKMSDDRGESISRFSSYLNISISYDEKDVLNIKEDGLKIGFFDDEKKEWIAVPKSYVDAENNIVSALVNHFTLFGVVYGDIKTENLENNDSEDIKKEVEKEDKESDNLENKGEQDAGVADNGTDGIQGYLSKGLSRRIEETDGAEYTDGTLIKAKNDPTVYVIESGRKRLIPNEDIFNLRFKGSVIEETDKDVLDKIPEGLEVLYPDGVCLRTEEDGKIYLIKNGARYHILSIDTWMHIVSKENPVLINVSNKEILKYELRGVVY